jgi:hypothetical protein
MFDNDYNRQIEWLQRIKKTTLVVGIDIGEDFNAVAYMHKEGNVLAKIHRHIIPGTDLISLYE